jgi:hypothetical protein
MAVWCVSSHEKSDCVCRAIRVCAFHLCHECRRLQYYGVVWLRVRPSRVWEECCQPDPVHHIRPHLLLIVIWAWRTRYRSAEWNPCVCGVIFKRFWSAYCNRTISKPFWYWPIKIGRLKSHRVRQALQCGSLSSFCALSYIYMQALCEEWKRTIDEYPIRG